MNDRNVTILENYDFTVLRTWKGRGAILCETDQGLRILKEYYGPKEKLMLLEAITNNLKEAGFQTDCLIRNKNGELICRDREQTAYIVKEYYEGRECAVTDLPDCIRAVKQLAAIHNYLRIPLPEEVRPRCIKPAAGTEQASLGAGQQADRNAGEQTGPGAGQQADRNAGEQTGPGAGQQADRNAEERAAMQEADHQDTRAEMQSPVEEKPFHFTMYQPLQEYERYHRELKRILKHLRDKSTKTDFEVFLLHHYSFFMEQAARTIEEIRGVDMGDYYAKAAEAGRLCHGDFQYHNILYHGNDICVINYEKCILDLQIRDLYHFFRKIMEKNNWNQEIGEALLSAYMQVRPLDAFELQQLYLRLLYPEKFRKVVSFYHNSGKSWIPGKNREKLEKLLAQEDAKQQLLRNLFL